MNYIKMSLIDENSDTFVFEVLGSQKLKDEIKLVIKGKKYQWTDFMVYSLCFFFFFFFWIVWTKTKNKKTKNKKTKKQHKTKNNKWKGYLSR